MRAVVEVNLIADIQAHAQRAEMAFETAARVKDAVDIVTTEIVDAAEKCSDGGRPVVDSKIDETAFEKDKRVNVVVFAKVHFRAELAVEDPQTRAANGAGAGGRVSGPFGEGLIEIVTNFTFQLEIAESHDTKAGTEAAVVRASLRQA